MMTTETTPSEPIGIKHIEMSERDKRVLAAKQRYVAKKAGEKQ